MTRRTLYFCGGVLCITIALTLFVYGQIIRPIISYTREYLASTKAEPSPSPSAVVPPKSVDGPVRRSEPKPVQRPQPRQEPAPPQAMPDVAVPTVARPRRLTPQPTPEPEPSVPARADPTPEPDKLTSRQCSELIEILDQGKYVYVPPECQEHYNAWRRLKFDRQRDETNERRQQQEQEREAERKQQQQQQEQERLKRQRQEQLDKTTDTIRGILRDIRKRP